MITVHVHKISSIWVGQSSWDSHPCTFFLKTFHLGKRFKKCWHISETLLNIAQPHGELNQPNNQPKTISEHWKPNLSGLETFSLPWRSWSCGWRGGVTLARRREMMKESVKPRSLPDKPAGPSSNKEPSKTRRASRPRSEMDTPLHCFDHGSWRSQVLIVRSFFYGRLMDVGTSRVRWRHLGKSWRDFVQLLCLVQRASVV